MLMVILICLRLNGVFSSSTPVFGVYNTNSTTNNKANQIAAQFGTFLGGSWDGEMIVPSTDGIAEVTIPYSFNALFTTCGYGMNGGENQYAKQMYCIKYTKANGYIGDCSFEIFKAAGDDFNVYGWLGCPDLQSNVYFPNQINYALTNYTSY